MTKALYRSDTQVPCQILSDGEITIENLYVWAYGVIRTFWERPYSNYYGSVEYEEEELDESSFHVDEGKLIKVIDESKLAFVLIEIYPEEYEEEYERA